MQYISVGNDDLKPENTTFLLAKRTDEVVFTAYTGRTAVGAGEEGVQINADIRGYFLRKGFSDALVDSDVIEPIFKTNDGKDANPASLSEARNLVYDSKLNISGFKFKENATEEQKEEAFGKLVNHFVSTSKNLDLSSDKNLFVVQNDSREVAYNNGGSKSMRISGPDVQEKLGMKTEEAIANKSFRQMMQSLQKTGSR